MTTGEWLAFWLAEKTKPGGASAAGRKVRLIIGRSYKHHVEHYLTPQLGAVPLTKLRAEHVAACYDSIVANPDRPGANGAMGAATLRRVHATLRSALNAAVRARRIDRNPAQYVKLPDARRPRVRPWEPAELGRFLDHAAGGPFGPVFETIAGSGARRGEALGLRWDDLDLEHGRAVVREQVLQLDGEQPACPYCGQTHHGAVFGPVKTASGEDRIIDLDSMVIGVLIGHRLQQDAERAAWGEAYNDHGLVFTREDGTPIPPERVTKRFAKLVKEAGLRPIRLHDLRDGRASLLLASGTDIALV